MFMSGRLRSVMAFNCCQNPAARIAPGNTVMQYRTHCRSRVQIFAQGAATGLSNHDTVLAESRILKVQGLQLRAPGSRKCIANPTGMQRSREGPT